MKRRLLAPMIGAALFGAVALGCEPNSITEAREQLGRGSNDTFSLLIPLVGDTFFVSKILPAEDTVTLAGGVLGIRVQSDSIAVFTFDQMLRTELVSTSVAVPTPPQGPAAPAGAAFVPGQPRDTIRFLTPAGSGVRGATVDSGIAIRTMTNNTPCPATDVNISLVDSLGATVVTFPPNVAIAPNVTLVDTASTSGARLSGSIDISTTANFGACVPPFGSTLAIILTFPPMTLSSVDFTNVNETFNVEEFTPLDAGAVDFEDLEDPLLQSTINLAVIDFSVNNDANLPLLLDGITIGVVQLDASGNLRRDGLGNPDYETDANGPLLVTIADSNQTTLAVAPLNSAVVSLNAAPLVDRMVKLLLNGASAAFVTAGNVVAGDGITQGSISRGDEVGVGFDVTVGLDFTLPAGGIQFDINQVSDGIDLDSADADDLASRVVEVGGTASAENFTPFGLEVTVAIAPDSLADSVDVFVQANAIFLDTMALSAPTVDAQGIPQGTTTDSVAVTITGQESRVLFGKFFTAGIRIRLLAGTGGGGRGAIRTDDKIVIGAAAVIRIRRGGS